MSSEANPDDVRVEIDTVLDDEDIQKLLDRVARDVDRWYPEDDDSDDAVSFEDAQHRSDFESAVAALRIVTGRDRRAESAQSGRTSVTYEVEEANRVKARVRSLDPGDRFSTGGVRRDTDRYVRGTGDR